MSRISVRSSSIRPRRRSPRSVRVVRGIGRVGVVVALTMLTFTLVGARSPALAAENAGTLSVLAPPGTPGDGQPLTSGGSARTFQLQPPVGAACSGDTANDGYRVQSFMVPSSVDPDTLTFDPLGPTPQGVGADFRQPLFAVGSAYVSEATAIDNGLLITFPGFSFDLFGSDGPTIVPEGDYTVGYACTLGAAGPDQLDKFWTAQLTITHDSSDTPAGLTWAVSTPTTTTTTTTTTTVPDTSSTTTTTTTVPDTSSTTTTTTSTTTTTTVAPTTTTTVVAGPTAQQGGPTPTLAATGPSSLTVPLLAWAFLLVLFGRMAVLGGREVEVVSTP